jgi:hypothetical protein
MQTQIRYVAEVSPVKEVTLHGLADLSFWHDRLAGENLEPIARDGQAQLFISATEARFWGILFRECLIGIHVQRPNATDEPAMFLLQAWNSLRAFAWIERNLFGTPYDPGQIEVEPQQPAHLGLGERGQALIAASLHPREPVQVVEEQWHGVIFLPRKGNTPQQLFVAKLAGLTERYPYEITQDAFSLLHSSSSATLGWLIDSHFKPQAWHIRQAAAHAKSKTYRADRFRV